MEDNITEGKTCCNVHGKKICQMVKSKETVMSGLYVSFVMYSPIV